MIQAAIFDFDGTLVDTMPLHYEAYRRVFAGCGIELSRDDFYGNIGGKASETIPKFLRGRPCPVSVQVLHARKKELVADLLKQEPIPVLQTAMLLDVFRYRVPMALASSGSREGIDIVLGRLGWQSLFSAIVSGEDAENGKPAPDIFLLAAQRLRVSPGACIVFEDTDEGIAAARRAGMRVFDVRDARRSIAGE